MNDELKRDLERCVPVKVPPLADALNLSRNGLYLAIRRKEVASTRIGRSIRVPPEEAARLLGLQKEPEAA